MFLNSVGVGMVDVSCLRFIFMSTEAEAELRYKIKNGKTKTKACRAHPDVRRAHPPCTTKFLQ